uniref:Uncharacterized protein n=1 Tax=Plectus sambesii TaxID=2011161 RepID=A0A914VVL3_9BILA
MKIILCVCSILFYFIDKSECQSVTNSPTSFMPIDSTGGTTIRCSNAYNTPEMMNGVPKNCARQSCSPGYECEYNRYYEYDRVQQPQNPSIVQYICCGSDSLRARLSTRDPYITPPRIPVTSGYVPPPSTGMGQVMMTYADPKVPMKCYYSPNCSLFPNYLNCVDSAKYGTKVCCSSSMCP